MSDWKLDRQDFVTNYMVSGPKAVVFSDETKHGDQLRHEAYLRTVIAKHEPVENAGRIAAGESSRLGMPWRYYYNYGDSFVNLSTFYSTMHRVAFDAAAVLIAPEAMTVRAVLWSYAAVDVYCNGSYAGGIASPVYKPISRQELELKLRAGQNPVYLACENLGVRDTRSVVGLQLPGMAGTIRVTLPDAAFADTVYAARAFLDGARLTEQSLVFGQAAPEGTAFTYRQGDVDYAKSKLPTQWHPASGMREIPLADGESYVTLRVKAGRAELVRPFERTERIMPQYVDPPVSREENLRLIFRRIADVESLNRGGKFGFPIANILARKYLGDTSVDDDALLQDMLRLIEIRVDCSDFLMCGLVRYLHNYPVEGALKERVRSAMLGYRYWMDMDGSDGMCFWSENHSLMFYSSAMAAGEMYPDDTFTLAHMTGRELHAWGRARVLEWLEDVEAYGFEEFLSTVYMCVTFAALINVVDYSEPAISARAARITDRLLSMLALHTYQNGIIAPMGRVYRNVLFPFAQGAMALMNLINPSLPYEYGEGWLGFYASSGYRIPDGLIPLMEQPVSTSYTTGNARILLEKHEDWCLTSVASPREPFGRWENVTLQADADTASHSYTKSFNERFHGTTCFQPGIYGYQQHMWHAALDGEAAVFISHPGSASEGGDMRPGYWHGNGVMPALKQQGGLLGMIYRIPAIHPIHYIHLYCPQCRFDEVVTDGGWIFLRKKRGFIALWSSKPWEEWNGMNVHCEQRVYGDDIACLCLCAGREAGSMQAFIETAKALAPRYDSAGGRLQAGELSMIYQAGQDRTQYL